MSQKQMFIPPPESIRGEEIMSRKLPPAPKEMEKPKTITKAKLHKLNGYVQGRCGHCFKNCCSRANGCRVCDGSHDKAEATRLGYILID